MTGGTRQIRLPHPVTRTVTSVLMILCLSPSASARQVPTAADDPVAMAPFRLGVLGLDLRIGISQLGVDTNVFNTTNDAQSDLTFTLVPGAQVWLRTARGLFSFTGNLEFVYFSEFETERSVNGYSFGQYEYRFTRFRPYVSASWLDTQQRPGYEIDARARHYERDVHAGFDLRVASRATVRLDVRDLDYTFAGDEVFNGEVLKEDLNRTLQAVELSWRQRLTALTTWVTRVSRETERFHFEELRNANSFRVNSGFELGRYALIRGSAFVGYRNLAAADGGIIPRFSGVTADLDVAYTAPTQTRLTAAVERDVQYSYEELRPYYVQTGWTATLTQRLIGRWDIQLSGGRDRLGYQAFLPVDKRTDFIGRFGGGIGYTVGDEVRVGFEAQSVYRSSEDPNREYGGVRAGVSVTYGY
jgi:Putative beta-barrel porin 2